MSALPPSSYTAALAKATGEAINEKLAPLIRRLDALESIDGAALLAQAYKGVFKDGIEYPNGALCTFDGALWIARQETGDRPGTSAAWQLAVKAVVKRSK